MSNRYLLPCNCQHNISIEIGQAGQSVVCPSCGQSVDVPSMRAIRQLKEDAAREEKLERDWSALQGGLFACGIFVTVVGLIVSGVLLAQRLKLRTEPPPPPDYTEFELRIDSLQPEEVWDVWHHEVAPTALGAWEPSRYQRNRQEATVWTTLLLVSLFLTGCGAACAVAAFKVRSRKA